MNNLVTVGIPTRKTKPSIYKAIQSILDQTYKNFEILVVDDSGESDNPRITAVKEKFKALPNFRVVHNKENLGIGGARNAIIDNAKGEYICFLSADDEYLQDYIETMVSTIKKHPNKILYSDYYFVNQDGKVMGEAKSPSFLDREEFILAVVRSAKKNTMFVCYNLFASREILKKHKFDQDFRFGEDLEHILRCILIEKVEFIHIPKILFKYCVRGDSMTAIKIEKIAENNQKIFKKINKLLGREVL